MEQLLSLENLTEENVWNLSEEEAFTIVETLQADIPKEERPKYSRILEKAFEFRSISPRRRDLRQDLTHYGYKFFQGEGNKTYLTGICKRKK